VNLKKLERRFLKQLCLYLEELGLTVVVEVPLAAPASVEELGLTVVVEVPLAAPASVDELGLTVVVEVPLAAPASVNELGLTVVVEGIESSGSVSERDLGTI